MEQQVDTKKLILKTKQYEFTDGLREIQTGVTFIFIGVFWSWLTFQPNWWGYLFRLKENYGEWVFKTIEISVFLLPLIISLGMLPLIKYIRRRWLWRESGMVTSFLVVGASTWHLVISGVVFVGTVLLGLVLQPTLKTGEFYIWSMFMVATGWSTAVLLTGLAKNIGISRYKYLGVFAWVASPLILFYQTSLGGVGLVFMLGWGVALLVSGLVALKQVWQEMKGETYV